MIETDKTCCQAGRGACGRFARFVVGKNGEPVKRTVQRTIRQPDLSEAKILGGLFAALGL